jgi:hypothetical protein
MHLLLRDGCDLSDLQDSIVEHEVWADSTRRHLSQSNSLEEEPRGMGARLFGASE